VAVAVFVLFGGLGRGRPHGITLAARAAVCLSGGCSIGLSGGETHGPCMHRRCREGTASVNDVLIEFGQWLDRQRGLAPITITNYRWNVEQFLRALPQPTQESVSLLDSGTVTAFMVQYCRDRNTNSAKSMARSVRSFLRFAHATAPLLLGLYLRFKRADGVVVVHVDVGRNLDDEGTGVKIADENSAPELH
jgi:hypothetical protein